MVSKHLQGFQINVETSVDYIINPFLIILSLYNIDPIQQVTHMLAVLRARQMGDCVLSSLCLNRQLGPLVRHYMDPQGNKTSLCLSYSLLDVLTSFYEEKQPLWDKMGFASPLGEWVRFPPKLEYVLEYFFMPCSRSVADHFLTWSDKRFVLGSRIGHCGPSMLYVTLSTRKAPLFSACSSSLLAPIFPGLGGAP